MIMTKKRVQSFNVVHFCKVLFISSSKKLRGQKDACCGQQLLLMQLIQIFLDQLFHVCRAWVKKMFDMTEVAKIEGVKKVVE